MHQLQIRQSAWAVLLLFGGLYYAPTTAEAQGILKHFRATPPPHCPLPVCAPTHFSHGCLAVEIVGEQFDTIEAYYKDFAYREKIDGVSNLHHHGVLLSPGADGLFVIRLGDLDREFQAVGWVGARTIRVTRQSEYIRDVLDKGAPVYVTWRSPWVLRLTQHDPMGGERVCLIRWSVAVSTWEFFDERNQAWLAISAGLQKQTK